MERDLRAFVEHFVTILEPLDAYLITAAVNEIKSGGFIKAILTADRSNKPGVLYTIRASPQMIHFKGGQFSLRTPVPVVVSTRTKNFRIAGGAESLSSKTAGVWCFSRR